MLTLQDAGLKTFVRAPARETYSNLREVPYLRVRFAAQPVDYKGGSITAASGGRRIGSSYSAEALSCRLTGRNVQERLKNRVRVHRM